MAHSIRPKHAALSMTLVAGLLLAACSTGPNEADANPNAGGRVTMLTDVDIDSLDPQQVTSVHAAMVLSHLYDTLVVSDFDQTEVRPLLAESWTISDDGTVYTFHLRDDVTFHSGKSLHAEDVAATLERWADEEAPSPSAQTVQGVENIEIIDDHTIAVTLKEPDNWFLNNLSMPWASILNAEALSAGEASDTIDAETLDGTGPFTIQSWMPGDAMTLERNEAYTWGPEIFDNQGPAHISEMTIRIVPEFSTRRASLQSGEADIIPHSGGSPILLDLGQEDPNVELLEYDLPNVQFLAFKTAKEQLEDVRVRQAINHAVDKQAIVDVVQGGLGEPAATFLHPSMKYHWEPGDDTYDYDPQAAQELLDAAGWSREGDGVRMKDGNPLVLEVYAGTNSEQELTLIASDLAAVGIDFQLNLVDRTALYDIRRTEIPDVNSIWLPMQNADVLRTYFSCDQQPSPNRFNFCDEDFDELLLTGLTSQDEAEVEGAYQEVQRWIHEEALTMPVYYRQDFVTARNHVIDLQPYPQFGIGVFKSLDIKVEDK